MVLEGGLILARHNPELAKKFNSLIFPGTQGGPLMHVIAAKAVAFKEALEPTFKTYQEQVILNAQTMAEVFIGHGFEVVSGGTDNHLFLLSLLSTELTGKTAETQLGLANITLNKNAVPNDPRSPFVTSGLRIGTPAVTTRGFKQAQVQQVAEWIVAILKAPHDEELLNTVKKQVCDLCHRYPVYSTE